MKKEDLEVDIGHAHLSRLSAYCFRPRQIPSLISSVYLVRFICAGAVVQLSVFTVFTPQLLHM